MLLITFDLIYAEGTERIQMKTNCAIDSRDIHQVFGVFFFISQLFVDATS